MPEDTKDGAPEVQVVEETIEQKRAALIDGYKAQKKILVFEDEAFGALGLIIFERPSLMQYRAYKRDNNDESKKEILNQEFLTKLVLYPSKPEFTALLEEMPGAMDGLANGVMAACGLRKFEAKKL